MTRWFRFYDDAINDPKILKLSDKTFRIWTGLLCLASKNDGKLPLFEDMAIMLRMKPEKLQPELEALIAAGLIDHGDDGMHPHNWNGRQYKSDDSSERVARYRDKRKSAGLPSLGDYSKFKPSLFSRDGERCVYCESKTSLVVDHMVPIALGGTDDIDNLALACKPCNSGKAGRTPELAGKPIKVASATSALARYRDKSRSVTVTITAPDTEQKQITEKQDADASRAAIVDDPQARYFHRVTEVLGPSGRSLGAKLLKAKGDVVTLAESALVLASGKANPREYIGAIIRGGDPPGKDARSW